MENRRSKQPNFVVPFLRYVFERSHILGLAKGRVLYRWLAVFLMYPPKGLILLVTVVDDENTMYRLFDETQQKRLVA